MTICSRTFPPAPTPRPEQARLLDALGDALAEAEEDRRRAARVRGRGAARRRQEPRRHGAGALERRRLPADLAEAPAGPVRARVRRRRCSSSRAATTTSASAIPARRVPTSQGMCRRPRGPAVPVPVRARQAGRARRARSSARTPRTSPRCATGTPSSSAAGACSSIDEAHNLESQLVARLHRRASRTTQMKAWFGAPAAAAAAADEYRPCSSEHVERLEGELRGRSSARWRACGRPGSPTTTFSRMPPTREEQELLEQRDLLETALARMHVLPRRRGPRVDRALSGRARRRAGAGAADRGRDGAATCSWNARTSSCCRRRTSDTAAVARRVLRARARAACARSRAPSPFPLEQRPIVYRPVGALSQATLARLEPAAVRRGRGDPRRSTATTRG